jgi:hypothetical protein
MKNRSFLRKGRRQDRRSDAREPKSQHEYLGHDGLTQLGKDEF